jgi:hypothetical protein
VAVVGFAIAMARPVEAVPIFDNGLPLNDFGYVSDGDCIGRSADDFRLEEGSNVLGDIHWWGFYFSSDYEVNPNPVNGSTLFTITVYDDANGLPGHVVWEDVARVAHRDTGLDLLPDALNMPAGVNLYAYDYVLGASLSLAPGATYWLSVLADSAEEGADWCWAASEFPIAVAHAYRPNRSSEDGWDAAPNELAFYLANSEQEVIVPEPATLLLFGLGVAGLAVRRLRRYSVTRKP